MPRRRSSVPESYCAHIAAETLEVRALLSSAAVAAHAAVHQAALHADATPSLKAPPITATGALSINGGSAVQIPGPGTLTISNSHPVQGSKVTIKVIFLPAGNPLESVKATLTGKVYKVDNSSPGATGFFLHPGKSSLTLKSVDNNKPFTAKAVSDAAQDFGLILKSDGSFAIAAELYHFGAKAPVSLANKSVGILLGPGP